MHKNRGTAFQNADFRIQGPSKHVNPSKSRDRFPFRIAAFVRTTCVRNVEEASKILLMSALNLLQKGVIRRGSGGTR
jgi:hypothetical protein